MGNMAAAWRDRSFDMSQFSDASGFFETWSEMYFNDPGVKTTFRVLQVAGGLAQAAGGALACVSVVGCLAGAPLILRGLDDVQAGARSLWHNKDINTFTYDAARWATGSDKAAFGVDLVTGLISPGGALKGLAGGARLTRLATVASKFDKAADAAKAAKAALAGRIGRAFGRVDELTDARGVSRAAGIPGQVFEAYCSAACRQAARRWSRQQANRRYCESAVLGQRARQGLPTGSGMSLPAAAPRTPTGSRSGSGRGRGRAGPGSESGR